MNNEKILSFEDIEVKFRVRDRELTAIRNVSLDVYKGETLAIVGESGAGKSVLTKTISGMLESNGRVSNGKIRFGEYQIDEFETNDDWLQIRGKKVATIFQNPMTSLNPLRSIGSQISEVIKLHTGVTKPEAKKQAIDLLSRVGIKDADKRYKDYPFQYSGGMRQRVVIAVALACKPEILICDEPTTALDVSIQAQILELIKELSEEFGFTTLFITHDLGVVANVADRVAVMYAGQIVEIGKSDEVFYNPQHPYTWALLSSLTQLCEDGEELFAIQGTPPSLFHEIKGDAFAPRNPFAMEIDFEIEPPMFKITETHSAKTWLLDPRAPKMQRPRQIENLHEKILAIRNKENVVKSESKKHSGEVLLSVRNIDVNFGTGRNLFKAVRNASFEIYKGETFGLVGESGSGKTTIGRAIIGINPIANGSINFKGEVITEKNSKAKLKSLKKNIQMIFQNPAASLNERANVDYIVSEGLYNFKLYENDEERVNKVTEALKEVGLLEEHITRYPHEFSGGQQQRIGIARALVIEPELIIADEPISALDVSIRAQVLNLMNGLQDKHGLTYLFIAHDLSIIKYFCDRVGVMHNGYIVEMGTAHEVHNNPIHPYTKSLLTAIPQPDPLSERRIKRQKYIQGDIDYSKGEWIEVEDGHFVLGTKEDINTWKV